MLEGAREFVYANLPVGRKKARPRAGFPRLGLGWQGDRRLHLPLHPARPSRPGQKRSETERPLCGLPVGQALEFLLRGPQEDVSGHLVLVTVTKLSSRQF